MDADVLREQILAAFGSVPRPTGDAIAPHRCLECDELVEDFSPFTASEIPENVFRKHVWDLPLLSAEAKHYYLPAWLIRSLAIPEGMWWPDECSTVVRSLEGDHRWDPVPPYTKEQWTAVRDWLLHVERAADSIDLENLERARKWVENEL
jgi:hypothetical protein